eukprot:gene6555-7231_t
MSWQFILLLFFLCTTSQAYLHRPSSYIRAMRVSALCRSSTTTTTTTTSTSSSSSFWQRLGSPKFISAPMVDHSYRSWRLLVKSHGTSLAFTQMIHAKVFLRDPHYQQDCIDWINYETITKNRELESYYQSLDHPLIAQLAGNDAEILLGAGRLLQDHVMAIDLNLGCPQKIAKRGNYGAYLLDNPSHIYSLVSTLVDKLRVPITVKLRKLETEEETLSVCEGLEKAGASMLTLHGRTRQSSKLFTGPVDWKIIRQVKEHLTIPVIANGGIACYDDVIKCQEITSADAIMSSEALLENPALFDPQGDRNFRESYLESQLAIVEEYLALNDLFPHHRLIHNFTKGHLFKMLHRFFQGRANEDLRKAFVNSSYEESKKIIEELRRRVAVIGYDHEKAIQQGYLSPSTWYMRHRTEEAQKRVLSQPKYRNVNLRLEEKPVSQEERLQALKERLLAKLGDTKAP